ncbi:hypothetical protein ACFSQE_17540 [Vogesella fluminis]|uniref:hypothetical protein n=1 Tax=Vogesella fluminis TaxID=1069161 RepID=UPI0036316212
MAVHRRIRTGQRLRLAGLAPEPQAVHRRLAARLARFVDRVGVQQHLQLVEKAAPAHAVCALGQMMIDVFADHVRQG